MSTTTVDSNGRVTTGKAPAARRQVAGTDRVGRGDPPRRDRGSPAGGSRSASKNGASSRRRQADRSGGCGAPRSRRASYATAVAAPSHSPGPGARARLLAGHLRRDGGHDLLGHADLQLRTSLRLHRAPCGPLGTPRLIGLLAILVTFVFAFMRVRRVRADHPGASSARLTRVYLRAIQPHWSLPTLGLGLLLSLGYF